MKEFTFTERDEFKRQPIAEKVINLLNSEVIVSPMVIDGAWGTGKTEFCHKLLNLMHECETHHLIYVDAFQADHADDPLLTVLAEVIKVLPSEEGKKSFIKKALPVAKYGMKVLAKAGVAHLLRQDSTEIADNYDTEIQKAADTAIDATVESTLKTHVKADENLKNLQEALEEIAETKPIVLFIDELDRCRPNFAVKMLETIKHTFAVKGVQFVLITNTQQLKASINHCYGNSVDAQRYLDKFVKFTFTLPKLLPNFDDRASSVTLLHYKNSVASSATLKEFKLQEDCTVRLVEHLINHHQISLREIETFIRYIEIYTILMAQNIGTNWSRKLIFIGIFLTTFKPQIAQNIITNTLDASELTKVFNVNCITAPEPLTSRANEFEVLCHLLSSTAETNNDMFKPNSDYSEQFNHEINRIMSSSSFSTLEECRYIIQQAIKMLGMQN